MKKNLSLLMSVMFVTLYTVSVFAQETGATAPAPDQKSFGAAIGAALAIGLGAFGGALGQGRVAAAALEGIARNPGADAKIRPQMILGLALIESLVLYALLVAYWLQAKV